MQDTIKVIHFLACSFVQTIQCRKDNFIFKQEIEFIESVLNRNLLLFVERKKVRLTCLFDHQIRAFFVPFVQIKKYFCF